MLAGCAVTVEVIRLDYLPAMDAKKIAEQKSVRVTVRVHDRRELTDRVGVSSNYKGTETAPILLEESLTDTVSAAVITELVNRGFEIGPGGATVELEILKFYCTFSKGRMVRTASSEAVLRATVRAPDLTVMLRKEVVSTASRKNVQRASGKAARIVLQEVLGMSVQRLVDDSDFTAAIIRAAGR